MFRAFVLAPILVDGEGNITVKSGRNAPGSGIRAGNDLHARRRGELDNAYEQPGTDPRQERADLQPTFRPGRWQSGTTR